MKLKITEEGDKLIVHASLIHRTIYRKRMEGLKYREVNTNDIRRILMEKGYRVGHATKRDEINNNDPLKLIGHWEFDKKVPFVKKVDRKPKPVKNRVVETSED